MNDENEKNSLFIQDINIDDKTLSNKIFRYFYSLFQEKKGFKSFLKYIQIFIETIQFISYAFSSIYYNCWKINLKTIKKISNIIGAFRLSVLMQYLQYKEYLVIHYILIVLIFIICLIVILQILFIDSTSMKYKFSTSFIRSFIDIIAIIFYIPITEIILIPIRCVNGTVVGVKNSEKCWENIHYLNSILGIIGAILLFIWSVFILNFSFYPFQKIKSTIRITSSNDIVIIIMKLVIILQHIFISNEYISLAILIIISITMFYCCYDEQTYNMEKIEIAITIKHLMIIWTYFILLISKLLENYIEKGFIYLLLFGYPIIIYLSIIISREKLLKNINFTGNFKNLNDYINKVNINIELIDSFIESNRNMRNGNENEGQRNLILLKGNIEFHCLGCTDSDCPLKKYIVNEGSFNIQRQCLLNYMNILFNKGFKKFPNSIYILILYIQFNYSKRFNLNSVKAILLNMKKLECTLKEQFMIYCMEQNMKNLNNNKLDYNFENIQDSETQEDLNEQKYQKLKYFIENSIKLYGEFWGIFSTNVTNNVNTTKLYSLGEKLNKYLNEINNLWDNELKNKKINNENQAIVQLYSKFLLEILWDRKKSKEVSKKLNDENLNNYHQNDNKKLKEEKINSTTNVEQLVDKQDYLLFGDSDEKGNCKIIQCSASFSQLLGYQKYDMIGKSLEVIYPNILIDEQLKYLEECIKYLHNSQNNQKDISYQEGDSNKNVKLIIVKNRMGYIFPLFSSINIIEDNDYSDSTLIKIKMEKRELKSEYAYYVLTNPDLSIENISSSAINSLGLSLDLLKKYVVKMDILIRTENNDILNIYENYNDYDEEPKIVTWVFPDIIYPKENIKQNKEQDIEELIEKSKKKKFNMQVGVLKFNGNENLAFIFKFTEIIPKKNKQILDNEFYIPKNDKNLIMFDLINLQYIRALLVNKKTGLRNLRNINEEENVSISKLDIRKKKKRLKNTIMEEEDESSEELEIKKNNVILTKEKILELQVHNYIGIKNFIFSLPLYGSDVSLERFRPNGDKYYASKMTEPLIKIQISNFCKRIDEKIHLVQSIKKNKNNHINNLINHIESPKSPNDDDNYLFSSTISSSGETPPSVSVFQREEINKGLASDSSSTLSNIFKGYSVKYIRVLIDLISFGTFILLLFEFLITLHHIDEMRTKVDFLNSGYIILNNMLYTKYFVTEGVLCNSLDIRYFPVILSGGKNNFLNNIKNELSYYRQEFTEIYDSFTSNEISKEYKDFMANTKIDIYTLTVDIPDKIPLLFNSAMTRIPAAVNDLASDGNFMNMKNRDAYELIFNLINEYYINWEKAISILLNDSINITKVRLPLMMIVFCYFIISVVIIIIFLKLLSNFSLDREKPINLFLTLKKQIFENLKASAENFSNKLLNKFFGNEDNEEESQQDYQANIKPNDINIIKFKALNEYNYSIKKAFSFIIYIIIILVFLLVNLIFLIIKYFDFTRRLENVNQFISLFDKNNNAQINFILSLDIFKSYLFNKFIPILNKNNTEQEFIETFLNISNEFEESIIFTSKTNSFLGEEYLDKFNKYLHGDFSELLDKEYYESQKESLSHKIENGLQPVITRVFEIVRYLTIKCCNSFSGNKEDISIILTEKEFKLYEINMMVQLIIRVWYKNALELMIESFYDFQNKSKLIYIILFICLLIFVILYYFIVWKTYEQKLILLLKGSSDLINLIPQEIKNIIIEKLNE